MKLAQDLTTTDLKDLGFEGKGSGICDKGNVRVILNGHEGVDLHVYGPLEGNTTYKWSVKFTGKTPAATIMAVLSTCPADSKEGA